jgi:hypothetical protein
MKGLARLHNTPFVPQELATQIKQLIFIWALFSDHIVLGDGLKYTNILMSLDTNGDIGASKCGAKPTGMMAEY